MSWFEKIVPSRIKTERRSRSVPEGLWIKCPACDAVLYRAELERNLNVCPKCSHHMRIGARERLRALLDPDPISEIGGGVMPDDPLKFKDSRRYRDRLTQAQKTEILTIIAPNVPAWRRNAIIGAFILCPLLWAIAIATLMWAVSDHDRLTGRDAVEMVILILIPLLLALFLAIAWTEQAKLAKLAPLIARLPSTKEQITAADKRRGMTRSI